LQFGVSGYVICRDTEAEVKAELDRILNVRSSPEAYASYQDFIEGSQLESQVSLEEYSVSNRGLRSGLIGTLKADHGPDQGVRGRRCDLLLLQFRAARGNGQVRRRRDQPIPGRGGRLAGLIAGCGTGPRVPWAPVLGTTLGWLAFAV
jgi:FMNH2-dependent dimethyl sulfone monooxygenase